MVPRDRRESKEEKDRDESKDKQPTQADDERKMGPNEETGGASGKARARYHAL